MKYEEAFDYLQSYASMGSVFGLDTMQELLRRLGDPQKSLRCVHIAGTNGKGSVLCMTSSVLHAAGYKVGRYLSPAVTEYRESWQINGHKIAKARYGRLMEQIKEACDSMTSEGLAHPTVFEMETALAFLWFSEEQTDVCVIECGMGGRLDATNVLPAPLVSVIVSVSRDHMGFLGDTVEEIAAEKAGIIKNGSRVVCLKQKPTVNAVFEEACERNSCSLTYAEPELVKRLKSSLEEQVFSYKKYEKISIGLLGSYQPDNACIALEVIDCLRDLGFKITDRALRKGLAEAVWPARFQVLSKKPLFIADGAHNADGAARLAESMDQWLSGKRIIGIAGILKDKETDRILEQILPRLDMVITCAAPGNKRAASAQELAEQIRPKLANVTAADSVQEAVEMAQLFASKEDVILAFGSLSFQGILLDTVKNGFVRSDTHGK